MAAIGRTDVLRCDALFISDLHLGSNQCEAGHLAAFLGCIRPRELFLVGDIIDLQAIRFNAHVDESFLTGLIDDLMTGKGEGLLDDRRLKRQNLLRTSHREVLNGLRDLLRAGTRITYIPGNHDAYLRRYAGYDTGGLAIRREAVYTTATGQRLLVRHGDEYDGLVHLHGHLAGALAHLQEHYSGWVNGVLGLLDGRRHVGDDAGRSAELILQSAVDLLARHREWPIPVSRGLSSSGGFSLAFALESALKGRTGHDRLIKRRIVRHLQREGPAAPALDGLINGHTHIPEATALALPTPTGGNGNQGPCHISYYNTGSWARSQRRLGRTGLVVAENGTIGMVRFDRRQGIEPFQPPRFPFNTYPMRPCPGCGQGVVDLEGG
ncbi:UDP-2,3-diacylglucosamine diphosphatase [Synechococcus sp. CCY 9618]|uniref:UDP-2,3-diacylglucosamine diphosphatase n=1 Tax=Synechococcus sp. CCY 9618 TaxID=2815602 RepID=UPI001C234D99|nr:UDP-2,3-diacylglucosamine diphosphatase [Synechococcus sp. CCY 9618]